MADTDPRRHGGRTLVAGAGPTRALVVVGVAVAALAGLSLRIPRSGATWWDEALDPAWVDHLSDASLLVIADSLAFVVPALVVLSAVLAAWWSWRVGHPRGAALVLTSPLLAVLITEAVLKPVVGRSEGSVLGFPSGLSSGMTSEAVAVAVVLCGAVARERLRASRRRWWLATDAVGALALNATIVIVRYHYATDVVGGCLLAVAVVFATAVVLDRVGVPCRGRRSAVDVGARPPGQLVDRGRTRTASSRRRLAVRARISRGRRSA